MVFAVQRLWRSFNAALDFFLTTRALENGRKREVGERVDINTCSSTTAIQYYSRILILEVFDKSKTKSIKYIFAEAKSYWEHNDTLLKVKLTY